MTDSSNNAVDLSSLAIHSAKPKGQAARKLAERGVQILPVTDDEGDVDRFIISKRFAVDRRTGHSFLNGIMDKTLFTSAIFLKEHFRLPVLILEGQIDYTHRGFDPAAVRGALSSMILEYGIDVIQTQDLEETIELLIMMARQEQLGIPEISLIPKRTAKTLPDLQLRIAEMLPGCGRVLARQLLQHFGSVAGIVQASAEELAQIKGIGPKKAREMQKVLNAEYEAVDTEKQVEDAVEAEPRLLFDKSVKMVARQLHVYDDETGRHIVDMVFHDKKAKALILVELKRGKVEPWHREQLRRYLDHARNSPLICSYLESGSSLHGVLASPGPGNLKSRYDDIIVRGIDANRVIKVLKQLRQERLRKGQSKCG